MGLRAIVTLASRIIVVIKFSPFPVMEGEGIALGREKVRFGRVKNLLRHACLEAFVFGDKRGGIGNGGGALFKVSKGSRDDAIFSPDGIISGDYDTFGVGIDATIGINCAISRADFSHAIRDSAMLSI